MQESAPRPHSVRAAKRWWWPTKFRGLRVGRYDPSGLPPTLSFSQWRPLNQASGSATLPSIHGSARKGRQSHGAYVITDVEITDASLYGQFLEQVTATVESHGGKCVARGGAIEVVLGEWAPKRIAILEFDSLDRVHAWLSSPEYTALDDMRSRSSNINMVVVEGA